MTQLIRSSTARRGSGVALSLVVGLFLAGCSESKTGLPQASTSQSVSTTASSPPVTSAPPSPTPPKPTVPLFKKYTRAQLIKKPCLSLDSRDLVALGAKRGTVSAGKDGPNCQWQVGRQYVYLDLNSPLSFAKTMTNKGRVTQVPVGTHMAVQSEFQRICFIFVGITDTQHLVAATAIPDRGAPQEGACPAAAAVTAAALTHIK
jgi:hypothetical protein